MNVLIVCSGTKSDIPFKKAQPFIYEQIKELEKLGVNFDKFLIRKKGVIGYLKSRKALMQKIKSTHYDIIHAHYGLSGMLAVLQRRIPVVISFIGSDINLFFERMISKLAMKFSSHNIFVSRKLLNKSKINKSYSIIPYGIDFTEVIPMERNIARELMKIPKKEKICLFGSSRNREIKNFQLAEKAVGLIENVKLIDLHGNYEKEEVIYLINASDCVILTSFSEGSPQFIKEAMACNIPIVSTDVGDVSEVINNTVGCFITSYNPYDVAKKLEKAITSGKRTKGREKIKFLNNTIIAKKIKDIYSKVTANNETK